MISWLELTDKDRKTTKIIPAVPDHRKQSHVVPQNTKIERFSAEGAPSSRLICITKPT